MKNASEADPDWRRLSGRELSLLARYKRTEGGRDGAIRRFFQERTNAPAVLGDDLIGTIDQYLKTRGRDVKALRGEIVQRVRGLKLERWTDAVNLIHVHTVCCYYGVIALGHVFRRHARTSVIEAYRAADRDALDPALLKLVIAGAFETSDLDLVRQAADDLARVAPDHPSLSALAKIGVIKGVGAPDTVHAENERYAEFLRGSQVAIVGPAAVREGDAPPALDDFKVIITMNARDEKPRDYMPPRAGFASYYNGEQARYLLSQGVSTPAYLDWTVVKKRAQRDDFDELNSDPGYKSRVLRSGTPLMFNGIPNALQNVLFDLATFEHGGAHVYLCDFMLSSGRQKGYFPAEWKRDSEAKVRAIIRKTFALKHDPVSQFLFTRALIQMTATGSDPILTEILGFSEGQFALALERVYRLRR